MSSTIHIDITLKAIEKCVHNDCNECPYKEEKHCVNIMLANAHAIIKDYKEEKGI